MILDPNHGPHGYYWHARESQNVQRASAGHACVGSGHSIRRGGKIHRRAQANVLNLLRTRGPLQIGVTLLDAEVVQIGARSIGVGRWTRTRRAAL